MSEILAFGSWKNNAELIASCFDLGYLKDEWLTLDPTYGEGRFWKLRRPWNLIASDINPKSTREQFVAKIDFTDTRLADAQFDAVVFDPPYKLNGTGGSHPSDAGYGVADKLSWQDRHQLIYNGIDECVRVLKSGGYLLIKCQDQVCSGAVKWQTRLFADHAESLGCTLVDMLHLQGYRKQPEGRRQVHARRNYSTMLVLRRGS